MRKVSDVHQDSTATTTVATTAKTWTPTPSCEDVAKQRQHVKRVNVQLPDDLHTRAKVTAVLKGITLNEYLEAAIRDSLERDKAVIERMRGK